MFGTIAGWILAHRRAAAVVATAIFLAVSAGAARLQLDFSFKAIIGGRDPAYLDLEHFLEHWSGDEKTTLVVATASDGTLLTPERLEELHALTQALTELDVIESATGPSEFPINLGTTVGSLDLTPLIEDAPAQGADDAVWAAWRRSVLANTTLVPRWLSADGKRAAIMAPMNINADDLLEFGPAMAAIRALLDAHDGRAGIGLTAAGVPATRADIISLMQKEMVLFSGISFGAMGLLLMGMFGSIHGLFIPLVTAAVPTALLFGIMGWVGQPVGLVSQVYPVLIPAIAVADTIHVLARFHDEARGLLAQGRPWNDDTRTEAIVSAMRHVGTACLFTSVTTIIGFLSLFVSDMAVLHEFGLFAAIGIAVAFVTMICVSPLLMSLVRKVPEARTARSGDDRSKVWLTAIATFTAEHPKALLLASAVGVLAAAAIASQVTIDSRLADALPMDHPSNRASAIVDEHLGGVITMHIDVETAPGALTDPAILSAMDRVEKWAETQPEFPSVQGPASLVRALNRSLGGADAIPEDSGVIAELFFLLDSGDTLAQIFDNDAGRGRVIVSTRDTGSATILPAVDRLKQEVEAAFAGTGARVVVTGVPYVAYRGFAKVAEELLASLLTAFTLIALSIGILFRSLRIAIISLVPNVVPLVVTLAALVLLGMNLELNSSIVFTVALALAVDNTIHILTRIYEERRHHGTAQEIVKSSLLHTGRALTITTAILVGAFGLNVFSTFPSLTIFGTLGAVAIASALATNFFMLPPLLYLFGDLAHSPDPLAEL